MFNVELSAGSPGGHAVATGDVAAADRAVTRYPQAGRERSHVQVSELVLAQAVQESNL